MAHSKAKGMQLWAPDYSILLFTMCPIIQKEPADKKGKDSAEVLSRA